MKAPKLYKNGGTTGDDKPKTTKTAAKAEKVEQQIARQYDLSKLPSKTEQEAWNKYLDWVESKGYQGDKAKELNYGVNRFNELSSEYNKPEIIGASYDKLVSSGTKMPVSREDYIKARTVTPEMMKNAQDFYKMQTKGDMWFGSETAQTYYPKISGMVSQMNPKNIEEMNKVNAGSFAAPITIMDYKTGNIVPYKGVTDIKYDVKTGKPIIDYTKARDYNPADSANIYVNPELDLNAKKAYEPYTNPSKARTAPVVGRKNGGVIKKYEDGGTTGTKRDQELVERAGKDLVNKGTEAASKGSSGDWTGAAIAGGSYLADTGAAVVDAKSIDAETGLYKSKGAAAGAGALKGAGTGASMGASIGTAIGGPVGTAIGAGAGALLGAGTGATIGLIRQNKGEKELAEAEAAALQRKKEEEEMKRYQISLAKQMQERKMGFANGGTVGLLGGAQQSKNVDGNVLTEEERNKSMGYVPEYTNPETTKFGLDIGGGISAPLPTLPMFKDGGKIEGPGTAKSDSILAKVKPGSFVVPAENAKKAEAIRQGLLDGGKVKTAPSVKKKANLNQEDGELVKLSNGEHLFTPEERKKIIYELGEEVLEMLAPEAEDSEGEKEGEYAKGGLTSAKAKTILRDGTVHGKPLTDKQKRFFGAIAGGQSVKEYMCGGKVKGYAEGGTTGDDEELKRIAKREAELKAKEEADKKKLEQQKQVAEKKAGAYEKTMTLLELRNEKKSELEQKLAKLERELKSKEKAYETYKKQQDALRDRKTTGGVRAQTNLYNEKERLAKEKELATEIKKYRDELETSAKQYSVISDDKNFNPDGTIKAKGKDPEVDKIFTTTGEKIMAADNADALSKAKGDAVKKMLTAPKIGQTKQGGAGASTKLAQSVKFKAPMGEASDTEVPVNNVPVAQTPEEKSLVESAKKQEELMAAQTGKDKTKPDYLKAGLTAAQGLSGLANYILPYKQYALGRKFLAEAGARPEDKIDPDFLNAVSDAQVSAKYGYTPEEQALLNQQNISALRAGENAARLYSGGSAANAYNLQRQAASDYFTRGLQQAVQNKQLQMSKQQYANDLVANKAEMSRRLFQDTMNAWQQKQQSGAALVGAGLQNLIGAKRLNDELAFNRDYAQGENAWYKTIGS